MSLPYAKIVEPVLCYFDGVGQRQRLDYYQGLDVCTFPAVLCSICAPLMSASCCADIYRSDLNVQWQVSPVITQQMCFQVRKQLPLVDACLTSNSATGVARADQRHRGPDVDAAGPELLLAAAAARGRQWRDLPELAAHPAPRLALYVDVARCRPSAAIRCVWRRCYLPVLPTRPVASCYQRPAALLHLLLLLVCVLLLLREHVQLLLRRQQRDARAVPHDGIRFAARLPL